MKGDILKLHHLKFSNIVDGQYILDLSSMSIIMLFICTIKYRNAVWTQYFIFQFLAVILYDNNFGITFCLSDREINTFTYIYL